MGRIIEKIKVVNYADEALARHKGMASDQKKRYIETEVLIDRSVKFLSLRKSLIEKLQLVSEQPHWTSDRTIYSPVIVYLRDRFSVTNVVELADDAPNLLGRIPLLAMDWVIDKKTKRSSATRSMAENELLAYI